jgi:hypothetical protein
VWRVPQGPQQRRRRQLQQMPGIDFFKHFRPKVAETTFIKSIIFINLLVRVNSSIGHEKVFCKHTHK